MNRRLGVLISGRGSSLQALINLQTLIDAVAKRTRGSSDRSGSCVASGRR